MAKEKKRSVKVEIQFEDCKSCSYGRFSLLHWNCNEGECHRYPPPVGINPYLSHWPVIYITDWCGEFKKHATD